MFNQVELEMILTMLNCMDENLVEHQGYDSEDVMIFKRKMKSLESKYNLKRK